MATILKELRLAGSKGDATAVAFLGSGSTYSCLNRELAEKPAFVETLPEPFEVETAERGKTVEVKEHVMTLEVARTRAKGE